ncbi:cadherin domain-containing protein [Pontibacter sp. H249]|uniref:cadherin domain-containing protein n=1 Tax=Pontibacter sp. H249 TaxID=3133420 RepID=UPI0030C3C26B
MQLILGTKHASFAQVGKNGAFTVTALNTVVNNYASIRNVGGGAGAVNLAAGATTVHHDGSVNFASGDLVMIIQMQGGVGFSMIQTNTGSTYGAVTLGNAGFYEFRIVNSATTTSFTVTEGLTNAYVSTSLTGPGNNNRAQIVKVPRYSSLNVNAGASIVPSAWNGDKGGIVALEVAGTTTINGTISSSGAGFRGGVVHNSSTSAVPLTNPDYAYTDRTRGAAKGESIAGSTTYDPATFTITGTLPGGAIYGRGAAANGGGGGNSHNAGGGGGANASGTGTWTGQGIMCTSCTGTNAWVFDPGYIANSNTRTSSIGGGRGGYTYSSVNADALNSGPSSSLWGGDNRQERGGLGGRPLTTTSQSRIFMGGGGGAGDSNNSKGTSGGDGGGIVYILSNTVTGSGTIEANGDAALNTAASGNDAPGGGGGGGTIIIKTTTLSAQVKLNANGGKGGNQVIAGPEAEGPGGGGGGGHIAFSGGTPSTITITGGENGTSNSSAVAEFPANGATSGNIGLMRDINSVAMPIASTDLSITHTITPGPYTVGQSVTVTLTARNLGTTSANNVIVSEVLPDGLNVTNAVATAGNANASNQWVIGNLGASATATLTITATIIANTANSNNFYTSVASIAGYQYDPIFANNSTTVTLSPVNQPPVITSNGGGATANVSVAENTTAVTTVNSTDPENNARTYSIAGGADESKFNINASTGVLTFKTAPDFEAPGSAAGTNAYLVIVRVTESGAPISYDEQIITVNVTNVNEAPTLPADANAAANTVAENAVNGTTVGITARSTDPEGGAITYILTNSAGGRFQINSTSGVVSVANGALLDFEMATSHTITVQVSDGALTSSQTFAITVTNVNEAPVITSNGGGATASITIAENSIAVTTVTATDVDANSILIYTISGGADQSKFSINATTGALRFINTPDFEAPASAVGTNAYEVIVRVTDNGTGALYVEQATTVTVTDENEKPTITSNGGGSTASITVAENTLYVTTVIAADPESNTLTYRIPNNANSPDYNKFDIDPNTGVITFKVAPDFETSRSAAGTNQYRIRVRVDEQGTSPALSDIQDLIITVIDVNDAPVITSNGGGTTASIAVSENTTAVTIVTAIDADANSTLTYTISGGADQGKFSIDATTGELTFSTAPDFEAPASVAGLNDYFVTVRATDNSGLYTEQTITVNVTNVNEAPVAYNATNTATVLNNASNVTLTLSLSATDADGGDDISKFLITNLPINGTLRINGVTVSSTTQEFNWIDKNTITYTHIGNSTADVVFSYQVKDVGGLSSNIATYTIPINGVPVVQNMTNALILNTNGPTPLSVNIFPTDDGSIVSFRVTQLPASSQGSLTINNVSVVLNRDYTVQEAFLARFDPDVSNLADVVFYFAVTDNEGALSNSASYTIPINGVPIAENVVNSKNLSSSALATILDALKGKDAEPTGTSITHFQIKNLPSAAQGLLYVNGNLAVVNTDYAWSLSDKISFDPTYGNTANVQFTFTIKDNEGAYDGTPATFNIPIVLDFDLDGITDDIDLDDDNDGIPDTIEGNGDQDGDGIPNRLDLDSDGDGILDAIEANRGRVPSATIFSLSLGRYTSAGGANGLANALETTSDSGVLNYTVYDTDNDTLHDYLDVDSDNDGILDNLEAQASGTRLLPVGADADKDGVDDRFDVSCGCTTAGTSIIPIDTDSDGVPDFLDLDSDNDGMTDTEEAYDLNSNGKSVDDLLLLAESFRGNAGTNVAKDFYVAGTETSLPEWLKESNSTVRVLNFQVYGNTYYRDTDTDGLIDLFDTSSFGLDRSANLNSAFRNGGTVTPLPVTLIGITAKAELKGVMIYWATAAEINNEYFIVERSLDGRNFSKIGQVRGAGTSSSRIEYNLLDTNSPAGTVYYRLKQVDFGGKYEYSKIVAVDVKKNTNAGVLLYPNPVTDFANVDLTALPAGSCTIRIISMDGRVVKHFTMTSGVLHTIDLSALATGKYVLQVQGEQAYKAINFIKK